MRWQQSIIYTIDLLIPNIYEREKEYMWKYRHQKTVKDTEMNCKYTKLLLIVSKVKHSSASGAHQLPADYATCWTNKLVLWTHNILAMAATIKTTIMHSRREDIHGKLHSTRQINYNIYFYRYVYFTRFHHSSYNEHMYTSGLCSLFKSHCTVESLQFRSNLSAALFKQQSDEPTQINLAKI